MLCVAVWILAGVEGWDATGILIRLGMISLLSVVTGLVAWRLYRRWKQEAEDASSFRETLSLDGLRAMRDRGELTDPEFRTLRDSMLKQAGAFESEDAEEDSNEDDDLLTTFEAGQQDDSDRDEDIKSDEQPCEDPNDSESDDDVKL